MDPGPTYLLIVTIAVLGVIGSFIVFLDYVVGTHDDVTVLIPIIIAAIVSIAGLAYGVQLREKVKNGANTSKEN